LEAHNSWEPKENVNAPELLIAFYSNNLGAIRMIKKEGEGCTQSMLSSESEECAKTLKPQPHTAGCRVMYLRSIKTTTKGPEAMAEPEQNSPFPSHTSFQQTKHSSTTALLPPTTSPIFKHLQRVINRHKGLEDSGERHKT
jgi:hypothetical protein